MEISENTNPNAERTKVYFNKKREMRVMSPPVCGFKSHPSAPLLVKLPEGVFASLLFCLVFCTVGLTLPLFVANSC